MEKDSGAPSEKDRKMMDSIESSEKSEKSEKKEAKEKKAEKSGNFFDPKKPEKDEVKSEKKTSLKKLGKLEAEETVEVTEQYSDLRKPELESEAEEAEDDPAHEAAVVANAVLLENLDDRIQKAEVVDDKLLDEVVAETAAELDIEPEEIEDLAAPEAAELVEAVDASEPDEEDEDDPTTTTATTTTATTTTPVVTSPVPPIVPPAVPPIPPHHRPPHVPPVPPVPPIPPVHHVGPSPLPGPMPGPHALPTPGLPIGPNILRPRHSRAGDLLLGGVIGYLIGRRRGRIKTEHKLLPVQHKLEKEVKTLHEKIAEREERIRGMAAKKVMARPEEARPALVEKIQARQEKKQEAAPAHEIHESRFQVAPERLAAVIIPKPEAFVPESTEQHVEAMQSATWPASIEIPEPTTTERTEQRETIKRVVVEQRKTAEALTMPELLEVAEKINIQGVNVRRMYEVGRLNAEGLRRVVKDYLHGERYERTLIDNLKKAEVTPEMLTTVPGGNDYGRSGAGSGHGGSAASASRASENQPAPAFPALPFDHPLNQPKLLPAKTRSAKTPALVIVAVIFAVIFLLYLLI